MRERSLWLCERCQEKECKVSQVEPLFAACV